ncbi:MAG: glycoside hydrolase family 26 protein [Bacteroidales bacterium]|nr:glycoside hydrolase family 26 protein [Bacteroidales bacterium]
MKNHYKYLFALPALALMMAACDDDEPKINFVETSGIVAKVTATSIAQGQEVDYDAVTSVTITYDSEVALSTLVTPTLNGESASWAYATDTDGNSVFSQAVVALSLNPGCSYVLSIPERAAAGVNSGVYAEAYTLNFTTKAKATTPTNIQSLTNSSATQAAQNLYSYLVDNYGSKMLTGTMGAVAWATDYYDFITVQAGAAPKVIGFDYIHLASSPANWIDYGDITPVKNATDAGAIATMSWHWNVPTEQGGSNLVYSTDCGDFSPSNVLVSGTWENEVAEADIAKLASYLQLLQDAGIAILWRPMHEAAGDYTWGPWFWWGKDGVDVTKQLWIYLHDKLVNDYGLNNLIWVWTMQTTDAGNLATVAQLQSAYPGDDYVDIVGIDLYPSEALTDQSASYQLAHEAVDGKKMVALSECGNLIDPAQAYANSALWSYFMQWYDLDDNGTFGFYNYSGPDQWQTVVSSPYVINR